MSESPRTVRPAGRAHRLLRMSGRDKHEDQRVATPLELLFDLTFVVGFSIAGHGLAHAVSAGHVGAGLAGFAFAMFAVCWAWINFTWFASAFDTDDWVYRVTTMVQMFGVLILALGIGPMFTSVEAGTAIDNRVMVLGYIVMRVAMVFQWLRAARQSPEHRRSCRTYAVCILIAQLGWSTQIFLNTSVPVFFVIVVVLVGVEMAGPAIAERRDSTPWHAHHIAERFGLLAIIALGEGIVGTTSAFTAVIDAEGGWTVEVALIGFAGTGIVFALWWTYFTLPSGEVLHLFRDAKAFVWGYGHIVVYAAIVAVGAGLDVVATHLEENAAAREVAVEGAGTTVTEGAHHVSAAGALLAVVVPVAVFTVMLFALYTWLVGEFDPLHAGLLGGAALFLALPVVLAAAGVSLGICLLALMLSPVVTIVGYEAIGHRHQADVIDRLEHQVAAR